MYLRNIMGIQRQQHVRGIRMCDSTVMLQYNAVCGMQYAVCDIRYAVCSTVLGTSTYLFAYSAYIKLPRATFKQYVRNKM